MNAKISNRLVRTMREVYRKHGIDEVNKRVGIVFKGELENFPQFKTEFEKSYEEASNAT